MDRVILVEVLGRGQHVQQRVRLDRLPATIGRGYASDVLLDDRHVDASHARIAADELGALFVEDLGSLNGLYGADRRHRVTRLALAPGAVFHVGHTTLRVVPADTPVPPAAPLGGAAGVTPLVERRWAPLLATAVSAPLLTLSYYLGEPDKSGAGEIATMALVVLLLVSAWAGVWALATRIASGRARFLAHLTTAWVVFGVAAVAGGAEGWLQFVWWGRGLVPLSGTVLGAGLVMVIVAGHLAVTSSMPARRRVLIAALIASVLVGLGEALPDPAGAEEFQDIHLSLPLKPLPAAWLPATSVDTFLARAAELQHTVDAEAEEDEP